MGERVTLGVGFGAVAAGAGAAIGSAVLGDNSFLTHLATGRLIIEGDLPRTDPYTVTAAGEGWVVQSWLASALYGALEELGGLQAIRLLMVATCAALGLLAWLLTRAAPSLLVRFGITATALYVGTVMWTHRPLLLGLVALGLALLAAEGGLRCGALLPVGWLWVNVHGSWPMGLAALGCLYVGARLDGGDGAIERRAGTWLAGGMALGALNPYGPALLVFPVRLLSRRESLEGIVEWQAVDFSRTTDWVFLALLLVGVAGLCRHPRWRTAVPLAVFGAAALTGLRNVPLAVLVLLPGLAASFADVEAGAEVTSRRSPLARPVAVLGVALVLLAVVGVGRTEDFDDDAYPVEADRWLREHDLHPAEHRIVARELVGNFFEARYGATGTVFIDDRMEVIPPEVVADLRLLLRGRPGWDEVLDRYEPDAVLWEVDSPLAELLELDPRWRIEHRDDDWLVAVPAR